MWTRSPLLLIRYPALLAAVMVAFGALAVASAAGPLFVSSTGNDVLAHNLDTYCPAAVGIQIGGSAILGPPTPPGRIPGWIGEVRDQQAALTRAAAETPELDAPVLTTLGSTAELHTIDGSGVASGRVVMRDGALSHVSVIRRVAGPGVWIADETAGQLGVEPGDDILLRAAGATVRERVAAVYRGLASGPITPFWCGLDSAIRPYDAFSTFVPPPFVLIDRATMATLYERMGEFEVTMDWEIRLETDGLTLARMRSIADSIAIQQQTDAPFGSRSLRSDTVDSEAPAIVAKVDQTLAGIRGPSTTISWAARAATLALVAAIGLFWVRRRRQEVDLLMARGWSPVSIGMKAVVEGAVWSVAASVMGLAAAWLLVMGRGRAGLLDGGVPTAAALQVALTAAAGIIVLGTATALFVRRDAGVRSGASRRFRAPWELAVLVLAAVSLFELSTRGGGSIEATGSAPPKVDPLIVVFPILVLGGCLVLAARGLSRLLPALRRVGAGWSIALYLASRRLASAPREVLGMFVAVGLAVGILAYAGILSASIGATVDAKAKVFTGSDASVTLSQPLPPPPSIAARTTLVRKRLQSTTVGATDVQMEWIDPSTFPRAAFWDGSFSDDSLADLLNAIRGSGPGATPVVIVGGQLPAEGTIEFQGVGSSLDYRTVGTAVAFPGTPPKEPLIVADQGSLPDGVPVVDQLWVAGHPAASSVEAVTSEVARVQRPGLVVIATATSDDVQGTGDFFALSSMLRSLQTLGLLTGLIALGALMLYAQAQRDERIVTSVLARRMGLSRRSDRRALFLEFGATVASGFLVGLLIAWVAARVVFAPLDPLPFLPPPPIFRVPWSLLGVTAAALVVASWLAAVLLERLTARAKVAEVMRVAV